MSDVSNSEDVLDSRDIIARIEELEAERANLESEATDPTNVVADEAQEALQKWDDENAEELATLKAFAEEASGYCSDWLYGETLIRDSYFQEYAEQLADDLGLIPQNASWPATCIDWEQAARELQMDYSAVDYDGVTYWMR